VGDLEVLDDDALVAELGAWLEAMGGPKRVVRGRKQGADTELVEMIWGWLLEASPSTARVADAMRA
jgi:hypothetical protein